MHDRQSYSPQTLPLPHAAADELLEKELVWPATFEANVEIFFLTCTLPHAGQVTPSIALALRMSSSNGWPHSLHWNSKIGIVQLLEKIDCTKSLSLDAELS